MEVAGAVREAIGDRGALLPTADMGPRHLIGAKHLVKVSLQLYDEV